MQGRRLDERELLDAESVAGHLVESGSVFRLLADHRRGLFSQAMFADLFPSGRGRPSVPGWISLVLDPGPAGVERAVGPGGYGGPADRPAVEGRLGLPIGHGGFDSSTLTYWRKRFAASERRNRISDGVLAVVAETGVLNGTNRRALDSTVLDDAVATQDTVTQPIAIIRKVPREIPGAAAVVAATCTAHDYDDPGRPGSPGRCRGPRGARSTRSSATPLAVLEQLSPCDLDPRPRRPSPCWR